MSPSGMSWKIKYTYKRAVPKVRHHSLRWPAPTVTMSFCPPLVAHMSGMLTISPAISRPEPQSVPSMQLCRTCCVWYWQYGFAAESEFNGSILISISSLGGVEADADEDDFLDRVSESAPVQCGWPWWHPDDSPADAYYPHCSVVTPGCRALYARERQRRADKKCTELVARIHLRLPERLCCCCLSANGTRPLMFLSTATCLSTIASNNACLHPDHL